jgi:branched-chain amino acid transport system substrate-binding protein
MMKKKRRTLGLMMMAILIVVFVTPCWARAEIKVGTLFCYTGPLKEFGPNIRHGAVLAAKQMEADGFKMDLIHEDTETSPIAGVNAAKKLVEIDGVVAIVGPMISPGVVAVAESVTCPRGIPIISPSATSPLISVLPADKGKDMVFRTCPSDALQGVVSGMFASTRYKTASIIYVNNPYGQGLAETFTKSFEKRRGKVLAAIPHDEKPAESYTAELKKALKNNPDVLCAFSWAGNAKIFLKESVEFFKYNSFLFCDGTRSEDIVKSVGAKVLEGQYGTVPASAGGDSNVIFATEYKEAYGKLPPLPFITNAYDAVAVIGLAAYAAEVNGLPMTSENIRDHLRKVAAPPGESIKPGEFKKAFDLIKGGKAINYEGASGSCDFDEKGDVVTPIEIWKYSRGDIVKVRIEHVIPKE